MGLKENILYVILNFFSVGPTVHHLYFPASNVLGFPFQQVFPFNVSVVWRFSGSVPLTSPLVEAEADPLHDVTERLSCCQSQMFLEINTAFTAVNSSLWFLLESRIWQTAVTQYCNVNQPFRWRVSWMGLCVVLNTG